MHAPVADQQRRVGEAAAAVCTHMAPLAGLSVTARHWDRGLRTCALHPRSFRGWLCTCRGLADGRVKVAFYQLSRPRLPRNLSGSLGSWSFFWCLFLLVWGISWEIGINLHFKTHWLRLAQVTGCFDLRKCQKGNLSDYHTGFEGW